MSTCIAFSASPFGFSAKSCMQAAYRWQGVLRPPTPEQLAAAKGWAAPSTAGGQVVTKIKCFGECCSGKSTCMKTVASGQRVSGMRTRASQ